MATVTDLASAAAATAAGYKLREYTRGQAFGATERVSIFSKQATGESGTTGVYQLESVGVDLATQTTARTNALAALNAKRRHRYAGAPGSVSGATVVSAWPDGLATVPVVDTN